MNKIEYKNGEVVVYNGDCFELIKNLKSQGIKVNTIVTDPPYNLLKGNDKHSKAVETNVDWGLFCKETYDLLEENSFFGYFQMFKSAMKSNWFNLTTDAGYEVKTELIWDKKQASDFLSSFPNQHESYYYFTKGKVKFNKVFYDKVTYKIANETDSISMWETVTRDFQEFKSFTNNKERLLEWIEYRFNGASGFTQPSSTSKNASVHGISQWTKPRWLRVLDKHTKGQLLTSVFQSFPHNKIKYNKDEYNIKHPTVKPIELFELLVKQTTNEGDVVFDPFLGSGTTALACLNTNRKFIGCELNEEYFNIIKERMDLATNPTTP